MVLLRNNMNITQYVRSISVFYLIILYLLLITTTTTSNTIAAAEGDAQLNQFQNAPTTTTTNESNIPTILDQEVFTSLEEKSETHSPPVRAAAAAAAVVAATSLVQNDEDDEDKEVEEEEEEDDDEENEEDDDSNAEIESNLYANTNRTASTTITTIALIKPTTVTATPVALPLVMEHSSNKTLQYTNTSDPLVQYDLECEADDSFCNKVSRAVGAAIDEFTRVIYVKNSLL